MDIKLDKQMKSKLLTSLQNGAIDPETAALLRELLTENKEAFDETCIGEIVNILTSDIIKHCLTADEQQTYKALTNKIIIHTQKQLQNGK